MPTDATGTPTALGIPTYNVDDDAPSGLGFNEAMATIDALIQLRAPIAGPTFTGTVIAPTPPTGDNSTKVATTAYVKAQLTNVADKSSASAQVFSGSLSTGPANTTLTGSQTAGVILTTGGVIAAFRASATVFLGGAQPTDTQFRYTVDTNGQTSWGPGGATAPDTSFGRMAAGAVGGNVAFTTGPTTGATGGGGATGVWLSTNGVVVSTVSGASNGAVQAAVANDSSSRWLVTGDGTMKWGPGTVAGQDITLNRSSSGQLSLTGGLTVADKLRSSDPAAGVGYATGAGGAANESAGAVTINKICGQITVSSNPIGTGGRYFITVTNSTVSATDVVAVTFQGLMATVTNVSNGSFQVVLYNESTGALNTAGALNFAVIKAVSA